MADGELVKPPPPPEGGIECSLNAGNLKSNTAITFAQVVQGRPSKLLPPSLDPSSFSLKPISIHNGKPSVLFKASEKQYLLDKLPYVLVDKFSHGRPDFAAIKAFFSKLKLQGNYNVSQFDKKHLFIVCEFKVDYIKIWLKLSWLINGKPMRILKWEPNFSPLTESAIAPVWVRLEELDLSKPFIDSIWVCFEEDETKLI
ncbi:hypothetical protein LIER_35122 [Lithospermum erythrorhizon]|uniref:DUF4283 domain-containing protein n=1 Tax=Lithospermum erythrorhizon TaxID=34254 RepID=A0AAV3NMF3_LITER